MLMKAYGIKADENASDNFADAGDTYYTGYLAAAKRLGITSGVGSNMYVPEKEITREQMFTLLYNALKAINKLPKATNNKELSAFNDKDKISSWAQDAMETLVKAGIVSGNKGNLDPAGVTNRAQMAQVIYNLMTK